MPTRAGGLSAPAARGEAVAAEDPAHIETFAQQPRLGAPESSRPACNSCFEAGVGALWSPCAQPADVVARSF